MEKQTDFTPYLTQYTRTNLRWITDLNVKAKSIKLGEENIKEHFHHLVICKDFLNRTPKKH